MNLKSILKSLKLNESTISMLLGAIVIIVVGFLVVNYFRNLNEANTLPAISTEAVLPTTHTVEDGEDLWKISEKYYQTGYNWVDIAAANSLTDPGVIEEGQELTIPAVEPKLIGSEIDIAKVEEAPTATPTITAKEKEPEEPAVIPTDLEFVQPQSPISGATYTVVRGDTLWDIAVRAYGDGFRWTDIAQENELVNPDLIHAGNKFVLPR